MVEPGSLLAVSECFRRFIPESSANEEHHTPGRAYCFRLEVVLGLLGIRATKVVAFEFFHLGSVEAS